MRRKVFLGAALALLTGGSSQSFACGFGLTEFACCETSGFIGGPERRILGGCEISRATAWARCVATGLGDADLRFEWGDDQCRRASGGGSPREETPTHHACSIARRGSGSFTYVAWGPKSQTSKEQLCDRARQMNDTGRSSTKWWYTTYWPDRTHKAVADCQNGTWIAYDRGIQSIKKVNEARKRAGGKGCIFKVDKTWGPR